MGQLLLVWLMHVSWVMATSVHDIYSPLMRRWGDLANLPNFFKDNYLKSTSWSYTRYTRQTLSTRKSFPTFYPNLPEFCPNIPRICPHLAQCPLSPSHTQFYYTTMLNLKPFTKIRSLMGRQSWLFCVLCVTSLPCSILASSYFPGNYFIFCRHLLWF